MALINLKFDSPIGNGPAEAQNQHFWVKSFLEEPRN
jgi:hypothetical protein